MTAERGVQVQVRRQLATAAAGQAALLAALTLGAGLGAAGLLAGVAYITTVCALLVRAVRRADRATGGWVPGDGGLGPANLITLTRAVLIGGVTALAVDR
ncbi:MAG TPA: hypothetical protein VK401_07030, partial [Propionibacteriaceae bacterium]|nr:hypothetical protein [Propionibacteriaceae bacterium]